MTFRALGSVKSELCYIFVKDLDSSSQWDAHTRGTLIAGNVAASLQEAYLLQPVLLVLQLASNSKEILHSFLRQERHP